MHIRDILAWLCLFINRFVEKFHRPAIRLNARRHLPRANSFHNGRIRLLLGLEGTLVCTQVKPQPGWEQIQVRFPSGITQDYYIKFRPFLNEFLQTISRIYTINIYTTQLQEYAEPIIQRLSIPITRNYYRYKQNQFFTQYCIETKGGYQQKEINLVAENPHEVLLVDYDDKQYTANQENSLKIPQFKGDIRDNELLKLREKLIQVDNILRQLREEDPSASIQDFIQQFQDN